jgi:hypothetical protein
MDSLPDKLPTMEDRAFRAALSSGGAEVGLAPGDNDSMRLDVLLVLVVGEVDIDGVASCSSSASSRSCSTEGSEQQDNVQHVVSSVAQRQLSWFRYMAGHLKPRKVTFRSHLQRANARISYPSPPAQGLQYVAQMQAWQHVQPAPAH